MYTYFINVTIGFVLTIAGNSYRAVIVISVFSYSLRNQCYHSNERNRISNNQ